MSEHEPISESRMHDLRMWYIQQIDGIIPTIYNHLMCSGEHEELWDEFYRLMYTNHPLNGVQAVFVRVRDAHIAAVLEGSVDVKSLKQTGGKVEF